MKHQRDPDYPQHESSFRCKTCKKQIEGFIYSLGDYDGPENCMGTFAGYEYLGEADDDVPATETTADPKS